MPVRLEGLRSITWGPRRAPKPPDARQRDRLTWGAATGPPKPPALGSAIDLHGGPRPGPPSSPRSAAPRQSRGAPRDQFAAELLAAELAAVAGAEPETDEVAVAVGIVVVFVG